jgi:hypothetical protein
MILECICELGWWYAVIAQPPLDHQCHLLFGKIMNNQAVRVLYVDLLYSYELTVLYRPPWDLPNHFLGEVLFFFSGLTAGPTYQPLVRHSNPDTPLFRDEYSSNLKREERATVGEQGQVCLMHVWSLKFKFYRSVPRHHFQSNDSDLAKAHRRVALLGYDGGAHIRKWGLESRDLLFTVKDFRPSGSGFLGLAKL